MSSHRIYKDRYETTTSPRIITTPNKEFGFDCGTLYRGTSWDTAMWKKEDTPRNTISGRKAVPERDNSVNGSEMRSTHTDSLCGNEVDLSSIQSQHTDISRGSSGCDSSSNGKEHSDEQEKYIMSSREETDSDIPHFTHYNISNGGTEEASGASEEEKGDYSKEKDMGASSSEDGERIASSLDSEREKDDTSVSGSPNISVSRESLVYDSNSEMLESGRSRESTTPDTGRSGRSRESTPVTGRSGRSKASTPVTGCYRVYTPKNSDVSPSTPYFFNPVILLDRNEILDNVHFLIKERDYYERELDAATIAIRCLKLERDILTEQLKAALRINGEKSVTLVKYIVEFHQSILEEGDGQTRILVDRPPVKHCTKTTFCLHECTHPNPPRGKYSTQFKENKSPPRKNYSETRPRGTNRDCRKFPRKVPGTKPNKPKPSPRKLKSKKPVYVQKDLSQRPPWDDSCFFMPKENKHKRKPTEQKSKPQPCTKTQENQLSAHEIIGKSDGNSQGPQNIDGIKSRIEHSLKLSPVTRDLDNTLTNDLINAEPKSSALPKNSFVDFGSAKSELNASGNQKGGMNNVGDKKFRSKVSSDRTSHNGLVEAKESLNNGAGDHLASDGKHPPKERKRIASKPVEEIQRHENASDGVKPRIYPAGRAKQNQPFSKMPENKPGTPLSPIPETLPPSVVQRSSAKRNLTIFPPISEKNEGPTREFPSKIGDLVNKSSTVKDSSTTRTLADATKTLTTKKINHHVNRTLDRLPPIAQPAVCLPPSTKSTKKESKGPRILPPLLPGRISLVSRGPEKSPTPPKAEKPKQRRPFLGKRL